MKMRRQLVMEMRNVEGVECDGQPGRLMETGFW